MPIPAKSRKGARRAPASGKPAKQPSRQAEVTRAASEIFWLKGYRAASIQDVADEVGVLKGSLYYYIDSKEDLLWRIVEDVHAEWSEILEQALALDVDSLERIRIFIVRHVEWYLTNVREVSVFFREWRNLSGDRLREARKRRHVYEQVIRDLFAAAQEDGEVSAELDLHYAARYVLAAVNAVPDWFKPSGRDTAASIAESYADLTVGLLTGTPRAGTSRARRRKAA